MKKILYWILGIIIVILISGAIYLNSVMDIITGYAAKNLCSAIFISERDAKSVEDLDLNFSFIKFAKNTVNYDEKSVTSRFLWGKSKALYRDGFGSVILHKGFTEEQLLKEKFPVSQALDYLKDTVDWPLGDRITVSYPENVNDVALKDIAVNLIDSQKYSGTPFSFLVLYKNYPVIEYYKQGFNQNTRLLSWSMAKSFTNAITGVMTKDGMVDIYQPTGVQEWQNDDRSEININDLLQMQSGLKWNEDYGSSSDVNVMLHKTNDMGLYAIEQPFENRPGAVWYYSSGSANIVCKLLKEKFKIKEQYYDFVTNKLFKRLGFDNVIFEVDLSGTYLGSSYVYATTRDFARFGMLYLNDGIFNGDTILPQGWVNYTTTENADSKGKYGSSFWLNKSKTFLDIPEDAYYCSGHDGQKIFIIPSRDVVMVVLGYSPLPKGLDFNQLMKDVLAQLPN